jgi:hypothetical protein
VVFGSSEARLVAIVFLRRGAVCGRGGGPVAKTSLIGHLNK